MENKTSIQPEICIIGSHEKIDEIFVQFDGTKFKFSHFLEALTFCFQIYITFNLKYPERLEKMYEFIERYFFEISTITKTSGVSKLISKMNSIPFDN
jgi:hypothetical protein